MTNKLTCLHNADGEIVGYFSDYVAEMAARQEWDGTNCRHKWENLDFDGSGNCKHCRQPASPSRRGLCRSHEVAIVAAELENVEPGDGDRVDFVYEAGGEFARGIAAKRAVGAMGDWLKEGASSVEVQRYLINKYRRPGMSARDSDLGGPVDAAGVLYVLKIKAPR